MQPGQGTTNLAVFTRNLRLHDNPVLAAAARAEHVIALFVQDDRILETFGNRRRRDFLAAGLQDLDRRLRDIGAALVVRSGDPVEVVSRLAAEYDVTQVHLAADVSSYAARRQQRLDRALTRQRRELVVHPAVTTVVSTDQLQPAGSDHYRVFTPYLNRWWRSPRRRILPPPQRLELPAGIDTGSLPQADGPTAWAAGETGGRDAAARWLGAGLDHYSDRHDDLAADATSKLSPYLHLGFLSPLELVTEAEQHPGEGATGFVRQLAWRDFHHQVLAARPDAAWQDYRRRDDHWNTSPDDLEAWQSGQTGFPLVDAGMRQLRATGWLHNRARMIVAGFLTKSLYQDWRTGARYFLDQLIDADLANNNLNWQWVAGTGTDTRPNRVLNPIRQAVRFDADARYIRRWVPELAELDDPVLAREPWRLSADRRRRLDYPEPIVDLELARQRFLAARTGPR